jgi:hypothetical protein
VEKKLHCLSASSESANQSSTSSEPRNSLEAVPGVDFEETFSHVGRTQSKPQNTHLVGDVQKLKKEANGCGYCIFIFHSGRRDLHGTTKGI